MSQTPSSVHAAFGVTSEDPETLFELLELLGKGSFGQVYKARHKVTAEIVAVKVISLDEDEEELESLREEIDILRECNHPNIVKYIGSYYKKGHLWIVMEYCGGGSVSDLMQIQQAPLQEDEIALIVRETLKGLAYLHSKKKLHRDIKGGNILLTEKGHVKLADFGVSVKLQNTLSRANSFVGTPYWMSPEVIQENRYDGRADVWSLACAAIEMAEMYPPLSRIHPMRVLFMIPRDPPPKLKETGQWTQAFHNFLSSALVKQIEQRPTAAELLSHEFVTHCKPIDILASAVERMQEIVNERGYGLYDEPKVDDDLVDTGMDTFIQRDDTGTVVMKGGSDDDDDDVFDSGTVVMKPGSDDDDDDDDDDDYDTGTVVVKSGAVFDSGTVVMKPGSDDDDDDVYTSDTMIIKPSVADQQAEANAEFTSDTFVVKPESSEAFASDTVVAKPDPSPPHANPSASRKPGSAPKTRSGNNLPVLGSGDDLQAVANKQCVNLPYLSLSYLDPEALMGDHCAEDNYTENPDLTQAMLQDSPAGIFTPQLSALVRTIDSHRARLRGMPMSAGDMDQTTRVVDQLNTTVKAIMRC